MFRVLLFRVSRRRAVGTLIGGLIILTLILTALGMMVFVSQQYDQYQQAVNEIGHYQDLAGLENVVAVTPGLTLLTVSTVPGWGSGCTTTYNCYNLTISNLGGVGVWIARIYINSTGTGCVYNPPSSPEQPCIINPSGKIGYYTFNQANQFLNTGEVDHGVVLALPIGVYLPNLYSTQNTVFIVTERGNVFTFQWPLPTEIFGGQSQSAFSTGTVKVAYQDITPADTKQCTPPHDGEPPSGTGVSGCDSSEEYAGAPLNSSPNAPYCHDEPEASFPAPTNYAEALTNIPSSTGVIGGTLYFVNPWITFPIFEDTQTGESPTTQLYIYINITNVGSAPYTVAGGTLDLTFSGSNHINGNLIGIYYDATGTGQFFLPSSSQTVAVGKSFDGIFVITTVDIDTTYVGPTSPNPSAMFWGSMSLTNNIEITGFVGGVGLSSGLWIRVSC